MRKIEELEKELINICSVMNIFIDEQRSDFIFIG